MRVEGSETKSVISPKTVKSGPDETLLDNPIWNALRTTHEELAVVQGDARRYTPAVGPLAGTPDQSFSSYAALRDLAGPAGILGLFFQEPPVLPPGWSLFRGGVLTQMIGRRPELVGEAHLTDGVVLRRLAGGEVREMIALAALTEPGPFRERIGRAHV